MTDTELLDSYISQSGLKLSYIAKNLGITTFSLQQKRHNISEFKPSEIEKLCRILKIESAEERMNIFFATQVDSESTEMKT